MSCYKGVYKHSDGCQFRLIFKKYHCSLFLIWFGTKRNENPPPGDGVLCLALIANKTSSGSMGLLGSRFPNAYTYAVFVIYNLQSHLSLSLICKIFFIISRCQQWVINCRRADLDNKSSSSLFRGFVLCEKHFEKSCIKRHEKRDTLKKGSIPTIFDIPNHPKRLKTSRPSPKTVITVNHF